MTFKKDEKTGRTRIEQNQLPDSNYNFGFQNKKLERQAVKGLTPKYCYAGPNAPITINNGAVGTFTIDKYTHNDIRFISTSNAITVPQAGLWIVGMNSYLQSVGGSNFSGDVGYRIMRNGLIDFGLVFGVTNKYMSGSSNCRDIISFPYLLNQGDVISLEISNNLGQNTYVDDLTKLSLISYILF